MTRGRASAALGVLALVVVLVLGARTPVRDAAGPPSAALGPESGQLVTGYVARAAATLREAGGGLRYALLSPTDALTPAAAAELAAGTRTAQVLMRVPVDRVQTPLLATDVADQGGGPAALAVELAATERRAGASLAGPVTGSTDRADAVAALSAARLRAGCACIVGLVLRGSPAALRSVADRRGVRALELAPDGAGWGGLSVVPLLPSQTTRAEPGPDDGPVPTA